jgi:hypothetical protein
MGNKDTKIIFIQFSFLAIKKRFLEPQAKVD